MSKKTTSWILVSIALIFLSFVLHAPVTANEKTPFDGCGTLVQGVECVMFEVSPFESYVLDQFGGFEVGAVVRVVGDFHICTSVCMQGIGCIDVTSITACVVPIEPVSFGMLKARFDRD